VESETKRQTEKVSECERDRERERERERERCPSMERVCAEDRCNTCGGREMPRQIKHKRLGLRELRGYALAVLGG
jgi:hypothetical protein